MLKKIMTASASLALLAVVGCTDDSGMMNPGQDGMMQQNTPDLSQPQSSPDMAFVCSANPMTNDELLNSCAPASVDHVDITPFYPAMAPNGVLPSLP
ncbi:MAG TPA: hypothetical protein VFF06_22120 [Polyangia bacterium]|nr:hypothetical protein [Polyangia bacterium]